MKMTMRRRRFGQQIVSDPPKRVGHGSQQVQENVEQGIIRVQVI